VTTARLSAHDRHPIDLARKLAALDSLDALREEAGADSTTDGTIAALAHFWGAATVALADLAAIAERLAAAAATEAGDD
jgi:hypothetical protein